MDGLEQNSLQSSACDAFLAQFAFRPELRGALGIEREFFIVDDQQRPVAASPQLLELLERRQAQGWAAELSACQIEVRTPARMRLEDLQNDLDQQEATGRAAAAELGFDLQAIEVAPDDMPLTLTPLPRYQRIAERLPAQALLASCQLAATHIHIGVANITEALAVYSRLCAALPEFMRAGDHSDGLRLQRYTLVAPRWQPPAIGSPEDFHALACAQSFADAPNTPKDCWWLIRINPIGTVEVRAFGAEPNRGRILAWASHIRQLANLHDH